jgi:ketosteroid isomerase-like protein
VTPVALARTLAGVFTDEIVQAWLDAYVEAWRTYDRDSIAALFSAGASYAYHPYDEPLRGRDAIVADWLANRDEPGSWEASYRPLLIAGDRAVATGETRYADGKVFSNLYVLRFDAEGRCSELVEWYVKHPGG